MNVTDNAAQVMKSRLRTDLLEAMKAGRADEVKVMRAAIAAIDNAEAPPLPGLRPASDQHRFSDGSAEIDRSTLSHDMVRSLLLAEQKEREQAAAEMVRWGKPDRAEVLRAEMLIIGRYLA